MEIKTSLTMPADAAAVFEVMTTPAFLEEVARESGATDATITVDGLTTVSRRVLPAPAEAQRFTGATITLVEERAWGEARADGSRTGRLALSSPGQPISMNGTVDLVPDGNHTRVDVIGDLKVAIPLIGKKLEKLAAPAVEGGIGAEERVGRRWLQQ